jgi:hypothetical protein
MCPDTCWYGHSFLFWYEEVEPKMCPQHSVRARTFIAALTEAVVLCPLSPFTRGRNVKECWSDRMGIMLKWGILIYLGWKLRLGIPYGGYHSGWGWDEMGNWGYWWLVEMKLLRPPRIEVTVLGKYNWDYGSGNIFSFELRMGNDSTGWVVSMFGNFVSVFLDKM